MIDAASGAQLADEVGKEPRVSPTGRFTIATVKNNIAVFDNSVDKGNRWKGASSLTIRTTDEDDRSGDNDRSIELRDLLIAARVVPFAEPERWEMIDGLKFTHLLTYDAEDKKFAAAVKRFVVGPIFVTKGDAQGLHLNNDPLRVASRGLGKVNLPEAELARLH